MIVDVHVHACSGTPGHGYVSPKLRKSLTIRFARWALGIPGDDDDALERGMEAYLARTVAESPLDAAVILALDAVHDADGRRDDENTHLYVGNDYVAGLVRKHPKMLFGASVHPYRRDAVAD